MSRLIDADALKADYGMADECKDCKTNVRTCEYDRVYTKMDFCGWLDDAPTVPQWIPCSERQPTEDGEYITTVEDGEGMFVTSNDWRQDWTEWGFLSYYGESDEPAWRRVTNVVAWMPLPEPYQEGEQNDI